MTKKLIKSIYAKILRCKLNYNTFANLWKPMEDFKNVLCWTMIRDSPDSQPGPTVTVTHDCTNEI